MTEFVSRITRLAKKVVAGGAIAVSAYSPFYAAPEYGYEHIASIHRIQVREYAGPSVVAFTNAKDDIAMPDPSKMPYENGVHSGPFVLEHEISHIYIEASGGIHDERGINNRVAYVIGPRYGIDRFPFASY